MELRDDALPIHDDARAQIRPRILLEGNFFVDIQPGLAVRRRARRRLHPGDHADRLAVTLPEILDVLDSDVRTRPADASSTSTGRWRSQGGGAKAFNRAIPSFEPAYRYGALTNDALLGVEPTATSSALLSGQQRTFAALADNPEALKELVTDLNVTAGAIASQDSALEASVPALRDTLRAGLSGAGRAERRAAHPARVRARGAARRALVGADARRGDPVDHPGARPRAAGASCRGLAADLRQAVPSLVQLNAPADPVPRQLRALSSCTNTRARALRRVRDPEHRGGQLGPGGARSRSTAASSASRARAACNDANTPVFHIQGVQPVQASPPGRSSPPRRSTRTCRPRTGPTCPARPRSRRTSQAPGGPAAPRQSAEGAP